VNNFLKGTALALSAYVLLSLPASILTLDASAETANTASVSGEKLSEASTDPNWGDGESNTRAPHTCKRHGKRSHYWWRVFGISALVIGGVVLTTVLTDSHSGEGGNSTPAPTAPVGNFL
jgi:hypothetical protein